MKALITLALLSAAGWYGYQHYMVDSPAVKAYKEFADAMAQDKYDLATSMTDGDAAGFVQKMKDERYISRGASGGSGIVGRWQAAGKQQIAELRGTSDQTSYQ